MADKFAADAANKNKDAEAPQPGASYGLHEVVFAYHGPVVYESKIVQVQIQEGIPYYKVHYQGWNSKWDEWCTEDRIMKFTFENDLTRQAILSRTQAAAKEKEARANSKNSKKKGGSSSSSTSGGGGSGGSSGSTTTTTATSTTTTSSSSAASSSSTSSSSSAAKSGRKRKDESGTGSVMEGVSHGESEIMSPIRLAIPPSLKRVLVNDWELIIRHQKLVSLPRTVTVAALLHDYLTFKLAPGVTESEAAVYNEIVEGMTQYFNLSLGTQLLYRFERGQYLKLHEGTEGFEPAKVYGAEHLLRLFVKLPVLLAQTKMSEATVITLQAKLVELLTWVSENLQLFEGNYDNATPEYIRMASN